MKRVLAECISRALPAVGAYTWYFWHYRIETGVKKRYIVPRECRGTTVLDCRGFVFASHKVTIRVAFIHRIVENRDVEADTYCAKYISY